MSEPLDPRLVYVRTAAGNSAVSRHDEDLSVAARRLLVMVDGRRPLAALPAVVRAGELRALIESLLGDGLISLSGIVENLPPVVATDPRDPRLEAFKRHVDGRVVQELGPAGSVLEARLQDCVNMTVMRSVLREVISRVRERAGDAAAARLSVAAQEAFADWNRSQASQQTGELVIKPAPAPSRKRRGRGPA